MHRRADVYLVARPDFLRADRPAHDRSPLQHKNFMPGFRQVARADQPVMARADDNGVILGFSHGNSVPHGILRKRNLSGWRKVVSSVDCLRLVMSFNTYARKVRDPNRDIWMRWSNIYSCLGYVAMGQAFRNRHEELFGHWKIGPGNPPTHEQLIAAINTIEAERSLQLEKLRVFERRRIREKMRGKRASASLPKSAAPE